MSDIPPTVPPATPPPPGGGSYTPPPPPPPGYTGGTGPGGASSDRTLMIVLAYLWLLALIPLITKKEDREVQWHAKHGLVLLGAEIIIYIILSIIIWAMPTAISCGASMVNCVVWIAFLVIHVLCIVKGVNGQRFIIPGLSDFADKF